jgi:hypothetical protein
MSFWISGHITGGLGNRLFQHASAMGLAEKWGHEVVFYLPLMEPTNHGPFENLMKLFPTVRVVTEEKPYLMLPEPQGHVFSYVPFQQEKLGANIVIDGWRQTARYFPATGVKVSFETCIPFERRTALLQKYAIDETSCFVHIRLGDYKILPHHQIDIGAYIKKASEHFAPGSRFLVFSDEAIQYKETLEQFVKAVGFVPHVVEESDELETLFLMSQCGGGAIVGNSTFSWWGAYFARQASKNPPTYRACYPEVWGNGLPPARDIIPSWGIPVKN